MLRGPVAGAEFCAPELVYSITSSTLTDYNAKMMVRLKGDIHKKFYSYDLYTNIFELLIHIFGSAAYCGPLFTMFKVSNL
jgi:hypothetical protein